MEILDERGHNCPIPVINTKKKLKEMKFGDVLTVKVSKPIQVENVKEAALSKGHSVETKTISDDEHEVIITVNNVSDDSKSSETCSCMGNNNTSKNIVAVISSKEMGGGDPTLSKNLMKAFIFALTKQEVLPEAVIFYNSGAYLTCEESESLDDIKALESSGVEILTCGTCLDFYNLKEKLKVGKVSNMYDIVNKMENATTLNGIYNDDSLNY